MPLAVTAQVFASIRDNGFGGRTTVNESGNVARQKLRYASRYFVANAQVTCTNTDAFAWYVGFVQMCSDVRNEAYYTGHGTRFDANLLPRCDCSAHPRYGTGLPQHAGNLGQTGHGRVQVPVGANNAQYQLSMNDSLASNVPWYDPVPFGVVGAPFPTGVPYPVTLMDIFREQRFTSYLVSTPATGGAWHIHKVIRYQLRIQATFDREKPLGSRFRDAVDHMGANCVIQDPMQNETLPGCLLAPVCPGNMNVASVFSGYDKDMQRLVGPLYANY